MNIMKFIRKLFRKIFNIKEATNTTRQNDVETPEIETHENFIGPSSYKNEVDLSIVTLKGNPTPTPAPDPVFSIFEFVGTKLLTGLGAAAWNTFYTEVINKGVTELTQILQNLEEINKKLDEMMKLYINTTYEKYINDRLNYVSALVNAQVYFNQQLTGLDADDKEAIAKILTDWSKLNISGNSAMVQWQNFVDFVLETKINTNTLYNVYDAYVYNTTPFEHLGYDYREKLRDMDFAAIVTNAILCILFIKQNPDITDAVRETQLNTISDKLKKYCDYYDAHKVVRKDTIVCQIDRTHFEMKPELWFKDFKDHSWFTNGTTWDAEHQESSWCLLWGDDWGTIAGNNCGKQLYRAEVNRIKNYYAGSGKSLWDILFTDMKLEIPIYSWTLIQDKIRIPLATWVSDEPSDSKHRKQSFGEAIRKGTDDISKEYVGTVLIEHTGFLWLTDTFRGWSDYDDDKKWLFMNVISRDNDNWKD